MTTTYATPDTATGVQAPAAATYEPEILALSGRIGRLRYFVYSCLLSLCAIGSLLALLGTAAFDPANAGGFQAIAVLLVYAGILFGTMALARRRFNDLNKSGWFALLFFVPLVNVGVSLWLTFGAGSSGPNRFGPAPTQNPRAMVLSAWVMLALWAGLLVAAIMLGAL